MAPPQIGRALVVVVDDRASHGERDDTTGPLVTELLKEAGFVVDAVVVVPGDTVAIRNALNTAVIGGVDLVITVGGTGVSPRMSPPDATAGVLDRPIPGIAEAIRASGLAAGAVDAGLSRGLVGVSGSTLVVNLAPSRAAVRDGMATLTPLVRHVIAELSGLDPALTTRWRRRPAPGRRRPTRSRTLCAAVSTRSSATCSPRSPATSQPDAADEPAVGGATSGCARTVPRTTAADRRSRALGAVRAGTTTRRAGSGAGQTRRSSLRPSPITGRPAVTPCAAFGQQVTDLASSSTSVGSAGPLSSPRLRRALSVLSGSTITK